MATRQACVVPLATFQRRYLADVTVADMAAPAASAPKALFAKLFVERTVVQIQSFKVRRTILVAHVIHRLARLKAGGGGAVAKPILTIPLEAHRAGLTPAQRAERSCEKPKQQGEHNQSKVVRSDFWLRLKASSLNQKDCGL